MSTRDFFVYFLLSLGMTAYPQEKKDYQIFTVAFYNVENLFDIIDDPTTFDDDRTPKGKDRWTEAIYHRKLDNMANAIAQIGYDRTGTTPTLIGLCEVENLEVLEDLVSRNPLLNSDYGIVHFDSPDQRGIDVALLYDKKLFTLHSSQARVLHLYESENASKRVYTRDQLVITGNLAGEKIHVIVNHWPSRSGGVKKSNYRRLEAARLNRHITDSLLLQDPYAKIINMGDFNDDPGDPSIKSILQAKDTKEQVDLKQYFNPMETLHKKGAGSSAYRDGWNLFDQILISRSLITKDHSGLKFFTAGIFNEDFLITQTGQYRGYPFRSMGQTGFTGGYSDHFPVYLYLIKPH